MRQILFLILWASSVGATAAGKDVLAGHTRLLEAAAFRDQAAHVEGRRAAPQRKPIEGRVGSGDWPRLRTDILTTGIRRPEPPLRPVETDFIARDRSTDLEIVSALNPLASRPLYHASIGSDVDYVVYVRNHGSVGKTVYVSVIESRRRGLAFRSVGLHVPAFATRHQTLPVRVMSAPVEDGYYRATIALMRSSDPRLSDVFRDADLTNNVFDVRIPVRPQRINIDRSGH